MQWDTVIHPRSTIECRQPRAVRTPQRPPGCGSQRAALLAALRQGSLGLGTLVAAVIGLGFATPQSGSFLEGWGDQVVDSRLNHGSYARVAAGLDHTVVLDAAGSIAAWGRNQQRQCEVPHLPPGTTYVGVAAGGNLVLASRSDGEVLAWGGGPLDLPARLSRSRRRRLGVQLLQRAAHRVHTVARAVPGVGGQPHSPGTRG